MSATAPEQLSIRAIVALTGVNPVTLRAWERRYGLLRPERTPKGHRLYTHEHVETIRRAIALVERGVPISRVRDALAAPAEAPADADAVGPWRDYQERMLAAVARFDEPELDRVYDEALSIHAVDQVTGRVILPLLARLGARWEKLAGGIGEEHFFATYLRSKLGARLQHRMRYAEGPRVVAACAPGEHHEIGLLLLALEIQAAGMRALLLGADTPAAEIASARLRSGAAAAVISACVDPPAGFLDRELPALVAHCNCPVVVGGGAALRHRRAIAAAGAVPLGAHLADGVRLIASTLAARRSPG